MTDDVKPAGSAADSPLWMKMVRDEDGLKWGNILVMLAVTVASGYLASTAQRAGSNPDVMRELKMKLATSGIRLGNAVKKFGIELEETAWAAYEAALP